MALHLGKTAKQSAFLRIQYAQTVKQKVLSEAEKGERDWKRRSPVGRVRLSRFARVKLLRNRLREKNRLFCSLHLPSLGQLENDLFWWLKVKNSN